MSNLTASLKDSAAVAFVAFLLFGPFLGLQLGDSNAGNLTLSARPELLAIAVILTFVARFLMLLWHEHRPSGRSFSKVTAEVQKSGKFVAPALLLFAVLLPVMPGVANSYIDLGVLVMTYVMLGWGLNIVVGLAGLLDLGYVAFYAVGAYSYALLAQNFGLGFWSALPLAGLFAACWGIMLGFPVLRLRGDYLAIVTLAFGEIIRLVIINWQSLTGGPNGVSGIPRPTLFGIPLTPGDDGLAARLGIEFSPTHRIVFLFYLILALALITNWVTIRLRRLPIGRAWEALRED